MLTGKSPADIPVLLYIYFPGLHFVFLTVSPVPYVTQFFYATDRYYVRQYFRRPALHHIELPITVW